MKLNVRAATDVGLRRQRNEDSHAWWMPGDPAILARRGVLLLVADGMGGAKAGGVASRLAVDTVVRIYRQAPGVEEPGADVAAELRRSLAEANRLLHEESSQKPELRGMATTLTAVVVRGSDVVLAHVGDSRAYAVRDGSVRQLTNDHSFVARLVTEGRISAAEARVHPRRNLLTRSVGLAPEVEIDAERSDWVLAPGDTLLLCSDGLHGLVVDEELGRVAGGEDIARDCHELITLANHAGGDDNITVLLARAEGEE
jgi:protein phosphatase